MLGSSISALLFVGRPSAIVGGVGAVVVDAINAMRWAWAPTHVSKEGGVVAPSLANLNPASSIVEIVFPFGIVASLANCAPRFPFRSFAAFAMFVVGSSQSIFCETPTRLDPSRFSQISAKNDALISAIASAQKSGVALSGIHDRKDDQAIKTLTSEVDDMVSHVDLGKLGRA